MPSQRPSQSAIFLSELRVVLPLIVLPLKTPAPKTVLDPPTYDTFTPPPRLFLSYSFEETGTDQTNPTF